MKRTIVGFAALALTASLAAAPLFKTPTESKWSVTKGGNDAGSVTLLTSRSGARAEFRASTNAPVVVFLSGSGKLWVRETGGDVEFQTWKGGAEKSFVPALIAEAGDATYRRDEKGPVEVTVGGYTLSRESLSSSNADPSEFVVKPRKGAASRLARLTGDLLGPSQTTVSPTAGGRGVGTKGLKLADGGDYGAVETIEDRDAAWAERMSESLAEFQKEGNVGKGRDQ